MIEELVTAAKQVGGELIDMSDMFAGEMETWADLLARNPKSATAAFSAGFINKASVTSQFEFVLDVQTPPDQEAILRTWAIETKVGDDQKEYFNNIQLTFQVDGPRARDVVAKGGAISRYDIRLLLQSGTSHLARLTVGDGMGQTHGERYDFTVAELSQSPDDVARVGEALREVLQTLKQSLANNIG